MSPFLRHYKNLILVGLSALLIIITPLISYSISVQEIPNPRQVNGGWVSDQANILSTETEVQLNRLLWQLKTNTGAEFAVVTVTDTASFNSPKEFTTELFNYWKIGEKGKSNGLLWLHSLSDRRLEIETGYGLESILPDARIGNIIRNEIIPKFKAGDFNGGTLTGVQSLSKIINSELEASLPGEILPSSQPAKMWQGKNIILSSVTALFIGIIAYIYAQTLARKPIYVSSISIEEIQSSNLNQLNIPNTENNLGINFLLWLASFILLTIMFSLIILTLFININDLLTTDLLIILFCVSLFTGLLACLFIKPLTVLIDQNPHSHSLHPIHCAQCQKPMVQVNHQIISTILNKHQQVAEKIGSIAFEGWQCRECYKNVTETDINSISITSLHLRRYVLNSIWGLCPVGHELTLKQSSFVSVPATQYSTGLKIVTKVCECCDYQDKQLIILPALPRPSSSSISSSDSGDSGGGYSDSGDSGGGNFGGGDFGGGDSGGGGAGDSY